MTRRCDSNPAQYHRNRRFGHLVHALGRAANGAKLPSMGLCLNASKAISFLVKGGNDIFRSLRCIIADTKAVYKSSEHQRRDDIVCSVYIPRRGTFSSRRNTVEQARVRRSSRRDFARATSTLKFISASRLICAAKSFRNLWF
ncbi:hypothetical protein KQX54_004587 [Cotesia glomerata]|uniref:Uncharacterized protein n=1 Tax=Cotesia glomerata TaxID=32391 RepID=A0AAV7HP25_COTGL|nr:hypothetical protein KQX54_004587 [Cotesia glomerata]